MQADATAVDADTGRMVFVLRRQAIPTATVDLVRQAYADLDELEPPSLTRRAAAGFVDAALFGRSDIVEVLKLTPTTGRLRLSSGRVLAQPMSNPVRSYLAGYSFSRFDRLNTLGRVTRRHPDKWRASLPFFQAIDRVLAAELPDAHQRMCERCALHPAWTIPDTALSTVTINVNYESRYHWDLGDYRDGYSTLSVAELGSYEGGYLVLPAYRVALDVRDGDVLLCQSHLDMHGNTAVTARTPAAKRLSFVTYLKHKLAEGVNRLDSPLASATDHASIPLAADGCGEETKK